MQLKFHSVIPWPVGESYSIFWEGRFHMKLKQRCSKKNYSLLPRNNRHTYIIPVVHHFTPTFSYLLCNMCKCKPLYGESFPLSVERTKEGWNNNLKTSEAFIVSYSSTESNNNNGLFILLSSKYKVPIKHLQTSTKKKLKKGFCSFPAQFSLTLLEP